MDTTMNEANTPITNTTWTLNHVDGPIEDPQRGFQEHPESFYPDTWQNEHDIIDNALKPALEKILRVLRKSLVQRHIRHLNAAVGSSYRHDIRRAQQYIDACHESDDAITASLKGVMHGQIDEIFKRVENYKRADQEYHGLRISRIDGHSEVPLPPSPLPRAAATVLGENDDQNEVNEQLAANVADASTTSTTTIDTNTNTNTTSQPRPMIIKPEFPDSEPKSYHHPAPEDSATLEEFIRQSPNSSSEDLSDTESLAPRSTGYAVKRNRQR